MAKKISLVGKLKARLRALGVGERKANQLATGLMPTASRATVSGTVTGKLETRLIKLGLSERKAKELAKGLAPTVRAAIKAKVVKAKISLDDVDDAFVNEIVEKGVDLSDDPDLDKVAPRVNGHRVRLDLPTVGLQGQQGIELLRVMHGLSTRNTYLVASVKGAEGIVAVRQFSADSYKMKFYPTMRHWDQTVEGLFALGATSYLDRRNQNLYERVMVDREALDRILQMLDTEGQKRKTRIKSMITRFMTVTAAPLVKAFGFLHRRSVAA